MLLNKIKKYINRSNIVSFDIFDTLLFRPYIKPSDVFYEIENKYKAKGFANARIKAEPLAWKDLVNENKDDVNLDEIYKYMPKKFQNMKQHEIQYESSCLHVNNEMLDVLNYAIDHGKKVIIASDMYLPSKELKKILVRELNTCNFKLYVSSEYGKRKHTGNLFKYIIKDLNVKPKEIFHIGDNEKSDYLIPKKLGIKSYVYERKMDKFIKNKRIKDFLSKHDDLNSRRFIGTLFLMNEIYSYRKKRDYWDKFAFLYGGPLAYNYVKMIIDRANKEKLYDLCFVARDGYTLEKITKLINPKIKTKYIYAPRFTSTLAYLDFGNKYVVEERKNVLLKFLVENGIAKPTDTIEQHKKELQDFSIKERKEYNDYIKSLNVGKRIGVVDSISMSYSAQNLIAKTLPTYDVCGFYWWIDVVKGRKQPKLYQFYNGKEKPTFCHLIEFLFAAPEFPIYRVINCKPVYKENIDFYEKIKIDLYPKLSKAMVDFTEIAEKFNFNPIIDDIAVFDWLNCFVKFANGKDFKHFKKIKNGVDQSHTKYDPVLKNEFWHNLGHIFYKKVTNANGVRKIYLFNKCIFKYAKHK